jgi:hypothetical protein
MMSELPETLFLNPVWHALHGPHRRLAVIEGCACRYPSNVSPFAAISSPAGRAFDNLRSLLALGEAVWIVDCGQLMPGLTVVDSLECLQMVLPEDVELPAPSENILPRACRVRRSPSCGDRGQAVVLSPPATPAAQFQRQ